MKSVSLRRVTTCLRVPPLSARKSDVLTWAPCTMLLLSQLQLLKGSFTLEKIADRNDSLRKEYENIKRVSYPLPNLNDSVIAGTDQDCLFSPWIGAHRPFLSLVGTLLPSSCGLAWWLSRVSSA